MPVFYVSFQHGKYFVCCVNDDAYGFHGLRLLGKDSDRDYAIAKARQNRGIRFDQDVAIVDC